MEKIKYVICIAAVMVAVIISCKTRYTTTTTTSFKATSSAANFDRGKVLVFSVCAGCHYDRRINKFIGTQIHDVPGIAGKVFAANLTHSKSNGITDKYSDAEIRYLLKTGVARDGRFLAYMLRPNMADEDINAIITYLRSNDPPLRAADTTVGITHFTFVGKAYMNLTAKPVPYKPDVPMPAKNNKVAIGYYLVDNLGCFHCHSKKLTSLNYLNPDQTKGYLAGGIKFKEPNGGEVKASNITPDKNTGIGSYTEEQFSKAIKEGIAPEGGKLKAPMPKFALLKDEEVNAIYAYLQTVPPKNHKIE
ncbi:c-type cytochrome [Mucilaginibacter sp. UR6-11]|uniref:c-type cytochrome n=1 Tax=Mucilaginibacter sp. UR6-11 TaxID=1435644 RepID=UPI001E625186|nr:c-type cytochrome [Mucilaginibacter sp. UR6-11]MCC8423659.1 cytochrome c [Mucilaginibacter sp. UR6-11]